MYTDDKIFKSTAKIDGICKPSYRDICRNIDDPDALLQLYVKGIDFCLANNFPSNEYLVSKGGNLLLKYGICVDRNLMLENKDRIVALGKSFLTAILDDFNVSEIFIKHNSIVNIDVRDNAIVIVDCFDNSTVNIRAMNSANVFVNQYIGARVNIGYQGENTIVKINKKDTPTYI